jgi:7,8-dihydroneopterin aldolase/epimerase/oxygenase
VSAGEDVRVELCGLEAFGPHGVTEAEREVGCLIELDITFTVPDCTAPETDELEGTVDYGAVARLATSIVRERSCRTLERLGALVADELVTGFGVREVEVRVAKPAPPIPETIGDVAVVIRREG